MRRHETHPGNSRGFFMRALRIVAAALLLSAATTTSAFDTDVKKVILSTDRSALGGFVRAHTDLNPWVIGAGAGVRF